MTLRLLKLMAALTFVTVLAACDFGGSDDTEAELSREPQVTGPPSKQKAKNVILFVGDGMGVSTVTATRIYVGQKQCNEQAVYDPAARNNGYDPADDQLCRKGEENLLHFETFDRLALVKTYNDNQQVPDSAGTATAMHTGVKTKAGVISIHPKAIRQKCEDSLNSDYVLETLGERAREENKAVGLVTTTRITHATPATVYAHSPERNWEDDADMSAKAVAAGCKDIAQQLIDFDFQVALGGGLGNFIGAAHKAKYDRVPDLKPQRTDDGTDLIEAWLQADPAGQRQFVKTGEELQAATPGQPLLGLFHGSHMSYMVQRGGTPTEPTLSEMTAAAIKNLSQTPDADGYFLHVESGRIDHGHHESTAEFALAEAEEFAKAVEVADMLTDDEDTLILVTADHSHVFNIAGYPTRGNPILGLTRGNKQDGQPEDKPSTDLDGVPYTTLGYLNGPGAVGAFEFNEAPLAPGAIRSQWLMQRREPNVQWRMNRPPMQQALVKTGFGTRALETHSGEDVALYASGPGADAVRGVIEQNKICNIIADAYDWDGACNPNALTPASALVQETAAPASGADSNAAPLTDTPTPQ